MPDENFGNFTLKEILGRGGMATVYRAYDKKQKRHVAVKILHEHFPLNGTVARRFAREAELASSLDHPNIVPVLQYGHHKKRPYIVMPYYSGGTLASYFFRPRELTYQRILELLTPLANALDYAHSLSIVHRDFKLQNILLDDYEEPSISDFGIARQDDSTNLTRTGQLLGTANYIAPEMVTARMPVDYRADLYALGVMAYLMLTGRYPFLSSEPLELAMMHRTETPPLPTRINPDLSQATNDVLLVALAKHPDERYQSATKFVTVLGGALSGTEELTTRIFIDRDDTSIDENLPETDPLVIEQIVAENNADRQQKKSGIPFLPILAITLIVVAGIIAFVVLNNNRSPVAADIPESTIDVEASSVAEETENLSTATPLPAEETSEIEQIIPTIAPQSLESTPRTETDDSTEAIVPTLNQVNNGQRQPPTVTPLPTPLPPPPPGGNGRGGRGGNGGGNGNGGNGGGN